MSRGRRRTSGRDALRQAIAEKYAQVATTPQTGRVVAVDMTSEMRQRTSEKARR